MAFFRVVFLYAVLAICAEFVPIESSGMKFINPPPSGPEGDFSSNPIYTIGSVVQVAWTPGEKDKPSSLTLWQLNATTAEFFGPQEYITQKALDTQKFKWIVATSKDLSVSNLFFLSIFEEGNTSGDSNSHYFNITTEDSDDELATSSTVEATTVATTDVTSEATTEATTESSTETSSVGTTSIDSAISATSSAPTFGHSDGLSANGKIGIGVAIPCALILGVMAGYWVFRNRKRRERPAITHTYPVDNTYNGMTAGPWGGGTMPQVSDIKQYGPVELSAVETRPPKLFELSATPSR